jgi:hypothetical protein
MARNSRIIQTGMGGFLNPPGHPEHKLFVETDLRRRPENRGGTSLSAAEVCEYIDQETRTEAARLLADWEHSKPPLDTPDIRDWVAHVLGYFRNCYIGMGDRPWDAANLRIMPDADPLLNADIHAGVHFIRQFYPEYQPTAADFEAAYWGQKPD